jgi:hypothetical protein
MRCGCVPGCILTMQLLQFSCDFGFTASVTDGASQCNPSHTPARHESLTALRRTKLPTVLLWEVRWRNCAGSALTTPGVAPLMRQDNSTALVMNVAAGVLWR